MGGLGSTGKECFTGQSRTPLLRMPRSGFRCWRVASTVTAALAEWGRYTLSLTRWYADHGRACCDHRGLVYGLMLSADPPKTRCSPRSFPRNFASAEGKPMKIKGECTCNSLLPTQTAHHNRELQSHPGHLLYGGTHSNGLFLPGSKS